MNGLKEKYPTVASTMVVIIFFPRTAREMMFIMKKRSRSTPKAVRKYGVRWLKSKWREPLGA